MGTALRNIPRMRSGQTRQRHNGQRDAGDDQEGQKHLWPTGREWRGEAGAHAQPAVREGVAVDTEHGSVQAADEKHDRALGDQ
jgi:hypothetical protein